MVILTVIADSNDHTVYFKEPLKNVLYMRLLSCSFYNSWVNLKDYGTVTIFHDGKDILPTKEIFPAGNYNVLYLAREIRGILEKVGGVTVKIADPEGLIVIESSAKKKIAFNVELFKLLGIGKQHTLLGPKTIIKKIACISRNYFINCDLLDKDEILLNGKPSMLLSCFEITGEPFERVTYSPK